MNRRDVVIEPGFSVGDQWHEVKTNVKLVNTRIEAFNFPDKPSYFELVSKHGPAVASLVCRLYAERGLESIYIHPYEITVHLAGANKVTDRIREIVKDFIYQSANLEDVNEMGVEVQVTLFSEDPSIIALDFNFEVTKKLFKFSKKYTDKNLKGLNTNLQKFLKKLVAIDGINGVEVSYYQIVIDRAPLFDIEAIMEEIMVAYVEFAGKA